MSIDIKQPQEFGGFGNFFLNRPVSKDRCILYTGENAGFQDALWGFGLKYAHLFGYLAARSITENQSFDHLCETRLKPAMETTLVNHWLYNKIGNFGYESVLRKISTSNNILPTIRRHHLYSISKRMLFSVAQRWYHTHLIDKQCSHEHCNCVRCRHCKSHHHTSEPIFSPSEKNNQKDGSEAIKIKRIQPYPVAIALTFVFLIFYFICVAIHLLLIGTSWNMYRWLELILFKFTWLTSLSFLVGFLEVIIAGFYVAYTLVPIYNYFDRKFSTTNGDDTMQPLRIKTVIFTVTTFGILTYVLCIVSNLIFPQWKIYKLWEILLPGFSWISWGSFFIGLIGLVAYGILRCSNFRPRLQLLWQNQIPRIEMKGEA